MDPGDDGFDADDWLRSFREGDKIADPATPYGRDGRLRNPVVDETFAMAGVVMDYCERLEQRNRLFAEQILASGTSVGSHTREAQGAESLADFVHKIKIRYKEREETDYRLSLCHSKPNYPHDQDLVVRVKRLYPLFSSILSTSEQRLRDRRK